MKTLLVTGGAGFIGSEFVHQAVARGDRVIVLDALTYAGKRENLNDLKAGSYNFVHGNICDQALVDRLLNESQPQAIVNFAAESHVDRSISGPAEFIKTNVEGTFTLLSSAKSYWDRLPPEGKAAFRYLQISTDEVFGQLGKTGRFNEDTPYAPNSPYAASKASADMLVRAWNHTYGLPTLITNCSNNYGPRQFPEKLIPLMITRCLEEGPLPVYGNGSNIRDWIHVEDHCAGVLLALDRGEPGCTYCFGGNSEKTNIDVIRQVCKIIDELTPRQDGTSHEKLIQFVEDRPGHDWRYAIDDSRAVRELGFKRKYDFATGIRQTVNWYLSRPMASASANHPSPRGKQ